MSFNELNVSYRNEAHLEARMGKKRGIILLGFIRNKYNFTSTYPNCKIGHLADIIFSCMENATGRIWGQNLQADGTLWLASDEVRQSFDHECLNRRYLKFKPFIAFFKKFIFVLYLFQKAKAQHFP